LAFDSWADAIGYGTDEDGLPSLACLARHVRSAVIEGGCVARTRITNGLKEAYRPFNSDESGLRDRIEQALRVLVLVGDIDEFATATRRVYTTTQPRRVHWGGAQVAILGGVATATENAVVRHLPPDQASALPAATVSLLDELGLADWRVALVSLGGADAIDEDPTALFTYVSSLASSRERFALEPLGNIAVLAGRGDFFGRPEPNPSGRWTPVREDGVFPAVVRAAYQTRSIVLRISNRQATVWQPPSRDIWRWVVVGATLAQGDPVFRYDRDARQLTFLTPLPRQIHRAVQLTRIQHAPWTWQVDPEAVAFIQALFRSSAAGAIPKAS
jgi:hypothetical protein